jgi:SulP family sulfate permease
MIFGVAKAIAREQAAMQNAEVLILDLSDVPMLDVTVSLSLENLVKDALSQDRRVLIVGATGQTRQLLDRLKLLPPELLFAERNTALVSALEILK